LSKLLSSNTDKTSLEVEGPNDKMMGGRKIVCKSESIDQLNLYEDNNKGEWKVKKIKRRWGEHEKIK